MNPPHPQGTMVHIDHDSAIAQWAYGRRAAEREHEIRELKSEVARHHRDFERVRAILDRMEADEYLDDRGYVTMLRQVVG